MKKKRTKLKYDNIFIFFSILYLGILFITYSIRFVYYYTQENKKPKTIEETTFSEYLISNDTNLLKSDDKYYYVGKDINNYVLYSGIMFRIVSISDGQIKLVTDENMTSLVMTYDQDDYAKTYTNIWLNEIDGEDYSGIFSSILTDKSKYLVNTKTCVDVVDNYENVKECKKYNDSYLVGLLSIDEYINASANNSYLNNDSYFWLSNINKDGNYWYVFDKGGLSDNSKTEVNYHSYAVRPTITLNKDVTLISGDGTKDNPYIFEKNENKLLINRNVGEYVNYGGFLWRIVSLKDGNAKLVLADALKVDNEEVLKLYDLEGSSYYNCNYYTYLNNTFYNRLTDKSLIIKSNWYDGDYNALSNFDYRHIYTDSVSAYVGLLNIGEMFIYDVNDAFLMTPSNKDMLYSVKDNKLFIEKMSEKLKVRPAIYIDGTVNITGEGTKSSPYEIEG